MSARRRSRRAPSVPRLGSPDRVSTYIRQVLSPDLLKPTYRRQAKGRPATYGHCYAASEAAYHLLGGKAAGWTPQSIRHEGSPHWFLRHRSGRVLDLTEDQFRTPVPHDHAVGKGFLTRAPSARARTIIRRATEAARA